MTSELQSGSPTVTAGATMRAEVGEQPVALAHAVASSRVAIAALVREAKRRDIRYVVLAARGTSDNAAAYAKYLLQIVCGLPVALAAPSVHTLYGASPNYRDALVVGVSQSGAGEDIAAVIDAAQASGALTAAITNTPDSLLARTAAHVLLCDAGVERAVAATKTYTTTLALFASFAAAWSGDTALNAALDRIGDAASRALEAEPTVRALAQTLWHAERLVTVARGLHLSTALEAALKIAETTYTPTQAFSAADLRHGPIASVAAGTPCLLFEPRGVTMTGAEALAQTLRARGARVLRFSSEPNADIPLADPGLEWLAPIVDILPAQLLAYHLSLARGFDPDHPAGLQKVTVTR